MTTKTGEEIEKILYNNRPDTKIMYPSELKRFKKRHSELLKQKWYLASDIDKRIKVFIRVLKNLVETNNFVEFSKFEPVVSEMVREHFTDSKYISDKNGERYTNEIQIIFDICFSCLDKDLDEILEVKNEIQ